MSRTMRLAMLALLIATGLAGGCKSSSGCSSCGAKAPEASPPVSRAA